MAGGHGRPSSRAQAASAFSCVNMARDRAVPVPGTEALAVSLGLYSSWKFDYLNPVGYRRKICYPAFTPGETVWGWIYYRLTSVSSHPISDKIPVPGLPLRLPAVVRTPATFKHGAVCSVLSPRYRLVHHQPLLCGAYVCLRLYAPVHIGLACRYGALALS